MRPQFCLLFRRFENLATLATFRFGWIRCCPGMSFGASVSRSVAAHPVIHSCVGLRSTTVGVANMAHEGERGAAIVRRTANGGDLVVAREAAVEAKRRRREEGAERWETLALVHAPGGISQEAVQLATLTLVTPLVEHVGDALKALRLATAQSSGPLERGTLASFVLDPKNESLHLATLTVQSQHLDMGRKTLQRQMMRLCCAAWCLDRMRKPLLANALVSARNVSIELAIESVSYDETPLPMRASTANMPQTSLESSEYEALLPSSVRAMTQHSSGALPTKLLQTCQEYGMIIRIERGGVEQHVMLVGKSLCHLQSLFANTPGCIMTALQEANATSLSERASSHFFTRLVAIDRHPSNIVVERRTLRRLRRSYGNMASLVVECRQHMLQTIRNESLANFDTALSGMVNLALSLCSGAHVKVFKSCLREVFLERFRIVVGYPSVAARARRLIALR